MFVFSYFGHHFPKNVIVCPFFRLFMWFLWNCKFEILLCFITYVNGKKPFMNPQVGSIILFCHLCELKKNHLWICMCVISFFKNVVWVGKITFFFFLFMCELKKQLASLRMCNIIFFHLYELLFLQCFFWSDDIFSFGCVICNVVWNFPMIKKFIFIELKFSIICNTFFIK
jgi:hypothetical protein